MKTRIRQLINAKTDGNLKKFADKCGVSQQTMINAVKKDTCTAQTLSKIMAAFPETNAHWLLTGEGDINRPYGLAYAEVKFLKMVLQTLELATLLPKMSAEQVLRFQSATAQGKMPEFTEEEINLLNQKPQK